MTQEEQKIKQHFKQLTEQANKDREIYASSRKVAISILNLLKQERCISSERIAENQLDKMAEKIFTICKGYAKNVCKTSEQRQLLQHNYEALEEELENTLARIKALKKLSIKMIEE